MATPVYGQRRPSTANTEYNQLSFIIQQAMSKINTATLVKVMAITGGGTSFVGTVDVLPLVNQVAGDGSSVSQTTIFGLPYFRLQGGTNAIICDPQVGDIGFCVFSDHDISGVKETAAAAMPGSNRRFDMADGLYLGAWDSAITPTQYLQIASEGITLHAPWVDTPTAYKVNNIKVVGSQQAHITFTPGGANPDPASQAAIVSILAALQAHGLTS